MSLGFLFILFICAHFLYYIETEDDYVSPP